MTQAPAVLSDIHLVSATRSLAATTMAAALIHASGRKHSVHEAVELMSNCYALMFPQPGSGHYDRARNDEKLKQPHV